MASAIFNLGADYSHLAEAMTVGRVKEITPDTIAFLDGYSEPLLPRVAKALELAGIERVRLYAAMDTFAVTLRDGRIGQGPTIRAAIENANHERKAA